MIPTVDSFLRFTTLNWLFQIGEYSSLIFIHEFNHVSPSTTGFTLIPIFHPTGTLFTRLSHEVDLYGFVYTSVPSISVTQFVCSSAHLKLPTPPIKYVLLTALDVALTLAS